MKYYAIFLVAIVFGCQSNTETTPIISPSTLTTNILTDAANVVIMPTYKNLADKAETLNTSIITLEASPSEDNLLVARNNWREVRKYWELSEAFLFGPVSTENIDPSIDTWPVNRGDLDSLLNSNKTLNDSSVVLLQESLKGFHPLEYLLFGADGQKKVSDFTSREWAYILSLSAYLKNTTNSLYQYWNQGNQNNFYHDFIGSGISGKTFSKKEDALLEVVNSMANICSEVGEGKIAEVVVSQNPELEESPFSKNSMVDFRLNIDGVSNIYNCKFKDQSGASVSQFVKQYNLALDQKINRQIAVCQQALLAVNLPFNEAIFQQQQQLNSATRELVALEEIITDELVPLIKQRVND